jgi:hypothetical protein
MFLNPGHDLRSLCYIFQEGGVLVWGHLQCSISDACAHVLGASYLPVVAW